MKRGAPAYCTMVLLDVLWSCTISKQGSRDRRHFPYINLVQVPMFGILVQDVPPTLGTVKGNLQIKRSVP